MATSDNRFEQGLSQSQWLDLFGPLVQFKVDKPGGVLPAEASNTRAIAEWFNTVDDLMLAAVDGSITGGQTFEYLDNTAAPQVIPVVAGFGTQIIEVNVTTDRNMLELTWFSLTRTVVASNHAIEVQIAQDSGFNDLILRDNFSQSADAGIGFQDEAGWKGNTLMIGPNATAPFSPSSGILRFYVKLTNPESFDSPSWQFAYVVKAFDLTLTEIPGPLS